MKISEILDNESAWTKECYARDDDGLSIQPLDRNAVCFCLLGAAYVADRIDPTVKHLDLLREAAKKELYDNVVHFNDDPNTTFRDVQEFLKRHDL